MKEHHVCPWYLAYTFDNPLRNLAHEPKKLLSPYVKAGMRVLDIGCGMGYFSIGMAKLVGDSGHITSVDLQPKMLEVLTKRAKCAGVANRITPVLCKENSLEVTEKVDFVLAFWVVHEMPDQNGLFKQVSAMLNPGAKMFIAEPKMHVKEKDFKASIETANEHGLFLVETPKVFMSQSAVLMLNK
ncbi:SAM-dependent methyltransferase [Candidatus Magnetomonas plexicatena]|uniref:SAM-dependent methyltransferase n=1 Tax=Candidatus Magnetomonas plexicatena TaxID=2552947 RepID=UPI0040330BD2